MSEIDPGVLGTLWNGLVRLWAAVFGGREQVLTVAVPLLFALGTPIVAILVNHSVQIGRAHV